MTKKTIFLGKNKADFQSQEVKGEMIHFENETNIRIQIVNELNPGLYNNFRTQENKHEFVCRPPLSKKKKT